MEKLSLRERVLDYASRRAVGHLPFPTEVPGLNVSRQLAPTELEPAFYKPILCLVLGGGKRVIFGDRELEFRPNQSLVVGVELPTSISVTEASRDAPYVSLLLQLDLPLLRDVAVETALLPEAGQAAGMVAFDTDDAVADAVERLFDLVDQPGSIPILRPLLMKEIHYRLLSGPSGALLRSLSLAGSQADRISDVMQKIRERYAEPLAVPDLARGAGMSSSAFHERFKAISGTTPLQYQKRLRLFEARRLLTGGESVSGAAFLVGYESPTQFCREFSRLFGTSPRTHRWADAMSVRATEPS